jgi:tetratricopeptide (TPR) repeat protein
MRGGDRYHVERTGAATAGPGGYANTGIHIGDVHISPPPRSGYRYQVELIAPDMLRGRDAELAELADFCTAPEGPVLAWWQAPAWSGKSALLAHFVLDPPTGVRPASFFVTARFAGHSDHVAFTDVLLVQLAEIAGQPLPQSTPATRYGDLLRLLHAAAEACREQGERLVLVVDGLDEDRGITSGPDAHSIAALLPPRLPAGMRVIVSGRPAPPLPADVPDGHPLRDPTVVRKLQPSQYAQVIRHEALRELSRLLDGESAGRDLLGLSAVAGGGLSAADLAELTGRSAAEVDNQFRAASGRSFAARPGRWRGVTVYLLAHEELSRIALDRLGEPRLAEYRSRLHAWADGYRDRGWPPETPEYLLSGYFRFLQAGGDASRIVGCAADPRRHDRILDITGGDLFALTETGTALDLAAGHERPDLRRLLVLAMARQRLGSRNVDIPVNLPRAWAACGRADRAAVLAGAITDPYRRMEALTGLTRELAADGEVTRAGEAAREAERAARSVTNLHQRAEALAEAGLALASIGDTERARGLADLLDRDTRSVSDSYLRAGTLAEAARVWAAAGATARARGAADRLEEMIGSIRQPEFRDDAHNELARARAAAGDVKAAEQLARALGHLPAGEQPTGWMARNPPRQAGVLIELVRALAGAGETGRAEVIARFIAKPSSLVDMLGELVRRQVTAGEAGPAQRLIEEIERTARCYGNPALYGDVQVHALSELMRTSAATGRLERALEVAEEAERVARSVRHPAIRAAAFAEVAHALATVGEPARARALAGEAERIARSATDPYHRTLLRAEVARALASTGEVERARELAERAERDAGDVEHPYFRERILAELLPALASVGLLDSAEKLVYSAEAGDRRTRVAAELVPVLVGIGYPDRAEALARAAALPVLLPGLLPALVPAMAAAGQMDRAGRLADEVESAARGHTDPYYEALSFVEVMRVQATLGQMDRVPALADHAERLTGSIGPVLRVRVLVQLVTALATVGDTGRARDFARRAAESARADTGYRRIVLPLVANAWATIGEIGYARAVVDEAERLIRSDADPFRDADGLAGLVQALAAVGERDRACRVADQAEQATRSARAWERQETLKSMVAVLEPDEARHLLARALASNVWVEDRVVTRLTEIEPGLALSAADLLTAW